MSVKNRIEELKKHMSNHVVKLGLAAVLLGGMNNQTKAQQITRDGFAKENPTELSTGSSVNVMVWDSNTLTTERMEELAANPEKFANLPEEVQKVVLQNMYADSYSLGRDLRNTVYYNANNPEELKDLYNKIEKLAVSNGETRDFYNDVKYREYSLDLGNGVTAKAYKVEDVRNANGVRIGGYEKGASAGYVDIEINGESLTLNPNTNSLKYNGINKAQNREDYKNDGDYMAAFSDEFNSLNKAVKAASEVINNAYEQSNSKNRQLAQNIINKHRNSDVNG